MKNASNDYVSIYHDAEMKLVMDVWEGPFSTGDNFRKAILYVLDVIRLKNCRYWLADLRKMEGSFDSQREWISTEAMPKAKEYGLKKEAILLPTYLYSRLSTKDAASQVKGIVLRQFDSYDSAIEWLKE